MAFRRAKKILPHLDKRPPRFPEDYRPPTRDKRGRIRRALAAAALMVALIAVYPLFNQPTVTRPTSGLAHVTACDRLASHPADAQKIAPGIPDEQIDTRAAMAACVAALKQAPKDGRTLYHLGRAHLIANDAAAGIDYLRQSADAGYAHGQFTLAQRLDGCDAGRLLMMAAQQRHFQAKVDLARNLGDGKFNGCGLALSSAQVRAMLDQAAELAQTPEEQRELETVRAVWPRF